MVAEWQTRSLASAPEASQTQTKRVGETPCGFDSRPSHQFVIREVDVRELSKGDSVTVKSYRDRHKEHVGKTGRICRAYLGYEIVSGTMPQRQPRQETVYIVCIDGKRVSGFRKESLELTS